MTRPFSVAHELFPFEQRFLGLAGARIDYVDDGAGVALAGWPSLNVWGTRDVALHGFERERFEATFPDHPAILFDNASHFLQEDCDRVAEAFRAFRRQTG
jgi:pimeloyl-ACP methyl ester carboxylesterase